MRIIAGKFKGKRFYPPAKNWPTRPTTDFAKEGLFNILANNFDFELLTVLDLFGGTGSHSYECISRGCNNVTYVDNFGACVAFVKKIALNLKITGNIKIVHSDVFKFLMHRTGTYDYIFAGPPYALPRLESIPDLIFNNHLLKTGGWFVLEHNAHHNFTSHQYCFDVRKYGDTFFSFFENPAGTSDVSNHY